MVVRLASGAKEAPVVLLWDSLYELAAVWTGHNVFIIAHRYRFLITEGVYFGPTIDSRSNILSEFLTFTTVLAFFLEATPEISFLWIVHFITLEWIKCIKCFVDVLFYRLNCGFQTAGHLLPYRFLCSRMQLRLNIRILQGFGLVILWEVVCVELDFFVSDDLVGLVVLMLRLGRAHGAQT